MCKECERALRKVLESNERFARSNRREFKVEKLEGDEVYLQGDSKPSLHVSHLAPLVHWVRDEHFICGVSSGTTAIKTLLSGKLADCSRCAGNASEAWGVLVATPGLRRDGQSGLGPDPSGL